MSSDSSEAQAEQAPKRRGRPPKARPQDSTEVSPAPDAAAKPAARRGRPAKVKVEESAPVKKAPTAKTPRKAVSKQQEQPSAAVKATKLQPVQEEWTPSEKASEARNDRQERSENQQAEQEPRQQKRVWRNDKNERGERNNRHDRNKRYERGEDQERNNQAPPRRPFNKNQGQRQQGYNQQGGQRRPFNKNKERDNRPQRGNRPQQGNSGAGRNYVPIGEPEEITGLIEITNKGFGFVRIAENNWAPSDTAVYVPVDLINEHQLRPYVMITGMAQRYERGHQLVSISSINGESTEQAATYPHFEDLKAVNPTHRLSFETESTRYTTRTIDIVAPVARGQRGLIVAPPRTGKTTILQHIAEAVREKYEEELHLMVLLVDERPEEVTEFKRCLPGTEIFASCNDNHVRDHCRVAEMCIERAKRLVEAGKHVLILMDSITRLARAYNNADKGSGRTMSGGIDARALEIPRRLFAAARNTRTAGSLTILATALIETNSRMDELIFQEFKGTGNMELVLNRRIAEMYIYPAVDILKSGTRREELILPELILDKVRLIRRGLAGHKPVEAMERLLFFLRKCPNNAQMLMDLKARA